MPCSSSEQLSLAPSSIPTAMPTKKGRDRTYILAIWVQAVLSVGFDDPADVRGRLEALDALKATPVWETLAAAVKRVANISGEHAGEPLDPQRLTEPAAIALFEAWQSVHQGASAALDARDDRVEARRRAAALKTRPALVVVAWAVGR